MSTFKASHLQLVGVFEVLKCPSQAARNGTCELCLKTMDLFTGAYGSEVPLKKGSLEDPPVEIGRFGKRSCGSRYTSNGEKGL